jgi:hypothetical protein
MLATLTANMAGMRREMDLHRLDFAEAKSDDRNSRAAMRDNMEELVSRVGKLETSVAVIGKVMAQDRDATAANTEALQTITPTVDQWHRMVRTGYGIVGLLGLGGISLGAGIVWWSDHIVAFLRWVLRIQ